MKQTGRRWIGCTLGMLLAVLLLGTTAFAGSADGALGSFVQDKLNELLEEQLLPNVPDQAQGMMDSLTQEKEDGGLFSLLSMTPSERRRLRMRRCSRFPGRWRYWEGCWRWRYCAQF